MHALGIIMTVMGDGAGFPAAAHGLVLDDGIPKHQDPRSCV